MTTVPTTAGYDGGPAERARRLREELWFHNEQYFDRDAPVISDSRYDALMQELRELEAAYPECRAGNSPTQRNSRSVSNEIADSVENRVCQTSPSISACFPHCVKDCRTAPALPSEWIDW